MKEKRTETVSEETLRDSPRLVRLVRVEDRSRGRDGVRVGWEDSDYSRAVGLLIGVVCRWFLLVRCLGFRNVDRSIVPRSMRCSLGLLCKAPCAALLAGVSDTKEVVNGIRAVVFRVV